MQSLMFVFIGSPEDSLNVSLSAFSERIEKRLREKKISIQFIEKEKLLIGRFDDVSYYVSFLRTKDELKDWYQMAKDFELIIERETITKDKLLKRYTKLARSNSNQYQRIHFLIGETIFEEMDKLPNLSIYSFQ